MYSLETFLVEEGYCYSIKEASKILECISDDFYYELQETAEAQKVSELRGQLKDLMDRILKETNPKKKQTLANEYKRIQSKISSASKEEKTMRSIRRIAGADNPASRSTPNRGRTQTTDIGVTRTAEARRERPMTGARINDPRVSAAAEREASRLTGTSAEVGRAGGSRQSTSVVRTGKYSDMGRSSTSGSTAALPNKGTSRTGARFPRG